MYYQNLFNQDYINQGKYEQYERLKRERDYIDGLIRIDEEQRKEITKMEKALNDFFDAAEKVIPAYQNQAKETCAGVICTRIFKNYR